MALILLIKRDPNDEIKDEQLSSAFRIAETLGDVTREGRGWRCRCAAHDGVSLVVEDGPDGWILAHCWAGCSSKEVFRALRKRGLLDPDDPHCRLPDRAESVARERLVAPHTADNQARALEIWRSAKLAVGTPVETYLRSRKLELADRRGEVLRFHPECPFKGARVPAMIGLLRDIITDEPCGIHRTALLPGASDRDRQLGKAMLGRAKGAAVKLTAHADVSLGLHIAEGIETGLALMGFQCRPAWSVGSAGGIAEFPVLAGVECLTIAVDHDESGAGDRAAKVCSERWLEAGRDVRLIRSPEIGEDLGDCARRLMAG